MGTYTVTGPGQDTFTVPDNVTEVDIECIAASGGSTIVSGGNGGRAIGTLSVTEGETLYVYAGGSGTIASGSSASGGGFPNGGDAYTTDLTGNDAAGGGGSSEVRQGGDTTGDIVILAGGGGGAPEAGENSTSLTEGAAGGGQGQDANDATFDDEIASGGTGGGASGWNGGTGSVSRLGDDQAAGGGGGGGLNGGGGGGIDVDDANDVAVAAGGGGGDGYVGGVTDTSTFIGDNSGDGQVTISWDDKPADPTNLTASVDPRLDVTLVWDDNANVETEYEVFRSASSGVDANDTKVGSLSENSVQFTDFQSYSFDYYYAVRAVNNTTASDFSNEIRVRAAAIRLFDESDGTWPAYTIFNGNGTVQPSINVYQNGSWVEY